MSLGIWDNLKTVPFVGSVVKGVDTLAGAAGLDGAININPESSYAPKESDSWNPEPEAPPAPEPPPYNPSNPFSAADKLLKEGTDKAGEKLPEFIPGWDASKSATENITGGFKVITDAFGNAAKAASELGSSTINGVKKWGPLALAGGLALLLLKK
jgi:hypothetical protein